MTTPPPKPTIREKKEKFIDAIIAYLGEENVGAFISLQYSLPSSLDVFRLLILFFNIAEWVIFSNFSINFTITFWTHAIIIGIRQDNKKTIVVVIPCSAF